MASISATGSLLKFPTLFLGRKSLNPRWRGPQFVHFPQDSEPSSSSGDSTEGCFKLVYDRRAVVLSSFGLLAGALLNVANDGLAVASEFADSVNSNFEWDHPKYNCFCMVGHRRMLHIYFYKKRRSIECRTTSSPL